MDIADWSREANRLLGRLCLFREGMSVCVVVRVIGAWVSIAGDTVTVQLHVVASCALCAAAPAVGSVVIVAADLSGTSVGMWRIYPLEADTVLDAMAEVEEDRPWLVVDEWAQLPMLWS